MTDNEWGGYWELKCPVCGGEGEGISVLASRRTAIKLHADGMRCNCDLDNWEPERSTGHSRVCRIHQATLRAVACGNGEPSVMEQCAACSGAGVFRIRKEPVEGMLVARNGRWYTVHFITDERPLLALSDGDSNMHHADECEPLLPSPSQLQAHGLTALQVVRELIGRNDSTCTVDTFYVDYVPGFCGKFVQIDGYGPEFIVQGPLRPCEMPQLRSATQKHTALLAYLDQFEEAKR